jgi:hypothetical protein
METRKFTKDQASDIMYSGCVMDDLGQNELYTVVSEDITDTDSEKSRVSTTYVIKEVSTDKFFMAELTESPWYKQAQANAEEVWHQVIPYSVTVTKYRHPNKQDIRDMNIDKVIDGI